MARRRRSRSRHLALRGAACSTSSRWLRGGLGFIIGGTVASIATGAALALTVIPTVKADVAAGRQPSQLMVAAPMLLPILGLTGSAVGAYVGARKPEC